MSSPGSRDELIDAVLRASRAGAAQAALFSQAVADRLGLAGSDVECLDLLEAEGRTTVGRLAELTGLTTGSATRMVDRLEQAGYVRRVADPVDRRRVLVEAVPEQLSAVRSLHDPIRKAGRDLVAGYDDAQLAAITRFLEQTAEINRSEATRLRAPAEEPGSAGNYAAPVGGVTSGRLVFVSGAPNITVRGDASLRDLYRAHFEGPIPRMRVRGGVVTVGYPRFGWFDWRGQIADQNIDISAHWRRDRGEIALNAAVPWAIELRGGASRLTADLRSLRLESFEMRGGANRVELTLPRPDGIVPIRVGGGMNRMEVLRPAGTAMGLEARGGMSEITVDGESFKGRGKLSIQSPGADKDPNRYEIEISGGVAKVSVTTY
jgi:DNA-binding MarR family transcriptional regulator